MIKTEHYITRPDGVELVRTYSDLDVYILCTETGALYEDAVEPAESVHTYTETDIPIPSDDDIYAEQIAKILLGEE